MGVITFQLVHGKDLPRMAVLISVRVLLPPFPAGWWRKKFPARFAAKVGSGTKQGPANVWLPCDELNWNWNLAQEWDKISILYWKYLRFWFWLIWVDLKVIWARLLLIHRSDPDLTARPRPRSKQSLSMVCCKVSICCLGKVHVWCMYMSQSVGTTPTWG
jgi:hypothetical protein